MLMENIDKVNELQNDARSAMEDWTAGRRGDIEGVMLATEQACSSGRRCCDGPQLLPLDRVKILSPADLPAVARAKKVIASSVKTTCLLFPLFDVLI